MKLALRIAKRTFLLAMAKDLGEKTAALTYSLILSLAPLIAIAFTLFQGFGGLKTLLDETIKPLIFTHFQDSVSLQLLEFLEDIINSLNTKALSVVGFVTFLTTVLFLLMNIEKSLNAVFDAKEERKLHQKFFNYWVLISFSPVVLAFSSNRVSQAIEKVANQSSWFTSTPLFHFAQSAVGMLFQFALFLFLYALVPNRKLKFRSLAVGAAVAFVCFHGVAWLNVFLTKRAFSDGNMTSLYGTIPLLAVVFFMWLRLLWCVVLVGGCVALATSEECGDFAESHDEKLSHWQIKGAPQLSALIEDCAEAFATAQKQFGMRVPGAALKMPLAQEILVNRGLLVKLDDKLPGHAYLPLTHSAVLLEQPALFLKWLLKSDLKSDDDVSRGLGCGHRWAEAFGRFLKDENQSAQALPLTFPEPKAFAKLVAAELQKPNAPVPEAKDLLNDVPSKKN